MEYVDVCDFIVKGMWCVVSIDMFNGDWLDVFCILCDIVSVLYYIYSKGLVYNDIKLGNILYSRDCGVVLCDLGLLIKVCDLVVVGILWYVLFEFIGLRQCGFVSDVWVLGVIMFYVLGKIIWFDVWVN